MKKYLYFIIAAAAVLSACAKEENSAEPEKPLDPATALFSGTIIQPNGLDGTKVSIDEEHSDASNTAIRWDENDEIVVATNDNGAAVKEYRFFADHDGGSVYFGCESSLVSEVSSWLQANDQYGYTAYYPAYTYSGVSSLDCTSEQYGNQASLVKMPLQAQTGAIQTPGHENRKLEFSSPYAILKFTVPSTLDADKMEAYLNNDVDYFVSVANFDKLEADESGNIVFYAPIPPTNVLWGYTEGYDKLTFVAKKAGQEEAVATMSTYTGAGKIYVEQNTIYCFDFLNTLEISEAGTYNLVQNGLDYRINVSADIAGTVTFQYEVGEGVAPANISINGRGHKINSLVVNTPDSHVDVENGEAVEAKSITGATTFVAKSTFHINTLTVEKGSVVVEGTEGVKNVDKIVISSDVQEPITINLEGVTEGEKVVIENQSSVEPDIKGDNYEEEEPATKSYIKVTEAPADWCGDYLIVYEGEDGNVAFDGSLEALDVASNTKPVSIENNAIKATDAMKAIQFTVAYKEGSSTVYSLKSASGKYISGTTTNAKAGNGIKQAVTDGDYEISFNGVSIESKSSDQQMVLKYNKSEGRARFRFYKSGQEAIALYKLEEVSLVSIAISGTPAKTSYSVGEKFDTDGLTVTATYEDASTKDVTSSVEWIIEPELLTAGTTSVKVVATYGGKQSSEFVVNGLSVKELSSISIKTAPTKVEYIEGEKFDPAGLVIYRHYSDETMDEYAYAGHADEFTFDPVLTTALKEENNKVTITYQEKSVDQGITVTLPTFSSLEDLVAADLKSGTTVKVSFEDVPIKSIFVTKDGDRNGIYFDIQKGERDIEIYYFAEEVPATWAAGGTLSGTMTCPWKTFNGTWELAPEKDSWSWDNLTYKASEVLTAPEITTQPTSANYDLNVAAAALKFVATGNPSPTYQWYSNTTNSNENGTALIGEINSTYQPSTASAGTFYYYCVATNSEGSAKSNVAAITVKEPTVASLPFTFDGGKDDIESTNGMSQSGLGSDYGSSPKLKFDSAEDYVVINFNEAATKVTYTIKGNGTDGNSVFKVMESADGVNYTIVKTHKPLPTTNTENTDNLLASSRFVKFVYTNKSSGNVALGNIKISSESVKEYTLTINTATNGSISAKVGENNVQSPQKIEAGKTVTLTATPTSGYKFESWTVTNVSTSAAIQVTNNQFTMPSSDVTVSATFTEDTGGGQGGGTTKTFEITSDDVVTNSGYDKYETTVDNRGWIITFGGNNKSVGTNSKNRSKCNLASYSKYAVSPVTTSDVASAFVCTTKLTGVKEISYTFNGGSNQTNTNVYVIYSADGNTFSQIALTSGTQGATISSGTAYKFTPCDGYFALLFKATNSSDNWRIDYVNVTFTYEE